MFYRSAHSRTFIDIGSLGVAPSPPTPTKVFEDAFAYLRDTWEDLQPLAERDVVWSLQQLIAARIAREKLPYRVYNDYTIFKGPPRLSADLVICDEQQTATMPVALAVEFKYEPDARRSDILKGKMPVVDWQAVRKDIERVEYMVAENKARIARAVFIDAGDYHQHNHPAPIGADWEAWPNGAWLLTRHVVA